MFRSRLHGRLKNRPRPIHYPRDLHQPGRRSTRFHCPLKRGDRPGILRAAIPAQHLPDTRLFFSHEKSSVLSPSAYRISAPSAIGLSCSRPSARSAAYPGRREWESEAPTPWMLRTPVCPPLADQAASRFREKRLSSHSHRCIVRSADPARVFRCANRLRGHQELHR